METFAAVSEIPDPSFVQYDVTGNIIKSDVESYDLEAQAISDEFKRPPY